MARGTLARANATCDSIPELLHVLGRAEAYELIHALARGPANTGELAEVLELEYSAISGKLALLKSAGLVEYRSIKKFHIYSLTEMVQVQRDRSIIELTFSLPSGERMTLHYPATSLNGQLFIE